MIHTSTNAFRILWNCLYTNTISIFLVLFTSHTMAQQSLNWHFFHPVKKTWIPAGTYGSVQEKLIETGELPNPFYGKNENLFGWIEEHLWEFKTDLFITPEQLAHDVVELEFPGIDTYAAIYVNNQFVGNATNFFRPYYFDIKKMVNAGKNEVKVVFTPPVIYHQQQYEKASYHLPAPNDVHKIAIAPYTRKPQYQFGWDWALRINTIGFLKPVTMLCYNHFRVSGINIQTTELEDKNAAMTFEFFLSRPTTEPLSWKSNLFGEKTIASGEQRLTRNETLANPQLWWPRGQGEQHLYEDEWTLVNAKNEILARKKVRFGVRKTELVQETDTWGTSYVIKVNKRSVFCKGGDYIPQDIFPARVKDADVRKMVETMAQSNFNMVRVWGGGYYPDEVFFEACDELGIMVWQDFMFACAMYPGDDAFLENVATELAYQIPRISSHASLTIFNGNNEVDVAWKNWGFQLKYSLYGNEAKEIETAYTKLFKELIPATLKNITSSPYIHTSPLSNWGKDEFYNHGTQHYWGVWHGKDPMENFAKKIGRFNAEYGFQSFPEYSTLSSFSTKVDWDLDSEIMKHHQKSYVGNGMILKHAKNLFGTPANFEEFVYFSQLTQARAVSLAVTGHRLDAPRCMGTLYWQINDCWPAPSWSSIDYFGNWKALQYQVKDDYEDVALLAVNTEKDSENIVVSYYLLSDQPISFESTVRITTSSLDGKQLKKEQCKVLLRGNEKQLVLQHIVSKKSGAQNAVIQVEWDDAKGKLHQRTFSELPTKTEKAAANSVSIELQSVNKEAKTAQLKVVNKQYLHNFWIYSSKQHIHFSSNFIDLLPGEHFIDISFEELPVLSDFSCKWL